MSDETSDSHNAQSKGSDKWCPSNPCDDDPCCERDPLNDIPWTIVFVTVVFVAMSIMLLYEMNAKYRAERQCKLDKTHKKTSRSKKSSVEDAAVDEALNDLTDSNE